MLGIGASYIRDLTVHFICLPSWSYVRNLRYEAKEYGKFWRFWIFWSVDRCHNAHSIYLYQTNTLFNINRHQDCEKIRQSWSPLVLSSVFDNYCSWMEDSERDDESISKYSFSQICVQILAPPRSRKFVWKRYDIPQICDPSRKFARLPHNCVIRKGIHAELRESAILRGTIYLS